MVDTRFAVSVHIMTALACSKSKLVTSPTLAKSVRTNPIVVRRLVARLVEHGLVNAFRGKLGGLELAKKPQEITLREVYLAATEKPLVAVANKPAQKECAVSCAMGEILNEVVEGLEQASLEYLSKIKLSDLAHKIKTN
jgi:Rrf2 family protein